MVALPTGTVTFLFTDIEGSTKLWEHQHDLMQEAFRRHEAILRQAIAAHGGYAYKMIGDAFQAAFQTAPDALLAALAAQQALAAEPWGAIGEVRVRMAPLPADLKPGTRLTCGRGMGAPFVLLRPVAIKRC